MADMLTVEKLTAGYGPVTIIEDVDIRVGKGEIVAVIGPNGAGKTTMMLSLMGLATVKSGRVVLDGEEITKLPPYERVVKGLVLSLERRRLFPDMTVYENVMSGAYRRKDKEKIREDYGMVAQLFPIIEKRRRQLAGTLSGGEQQMVAIARALMSKPRVLLLDEPSVGLAPIARRMVFEKIKEIRERQGLSILVVEQDASLALQTADRAYVLEQGRIAMEGVGLALLNSEKIRQSYIGI
ncbi:MAG: ABC transporter ATP-binding protein [Candidatus Caldarchaeum sp.]|nr:ABC transporter ATP-binding protein [Candidatus Caldarchaeum sp.]MCX8201471.1 ABC transporter ATP-binding protein [Candidatus Caldarchaeum sp.]MDW8063219.1 ABC transporter ATP-binding protein [Candidatus Caldarchaeum sp.]MDW8436300.1 ABC transporter ATP-binding protein [Candidatus Caldarchaeum sp.]